MMINSLTNYLGYEFVQNALVAGTLAAILGAIVGYFVIIRNAGFAAHALAHIGFAGAAVAGSRAGGRAITRSACRHAAAPEMHDRSIKLTAVRFRRAA